MKVCFKKYKKLAEKSCHWNFKHGRSLFVKQKSYFSHIPPLGQPWGPNIKFNTICTNTVPFVTFHHFFLKLFIIKLVLGLHLTDDLQVVFFAALHFLPHLPLHLHLLHLLDVHDHLPLHRQQGIATLTPQRCFRTILVASD